MFVTPADPLSMAIAMAVALSCFLLGVIWAAVLKAPVLGPTLIAFSLSASVLALALLPSPTSTLILFHTANVVLGVFACRLVIQGRRLIFSVLGVAFMLGFLLGPVGVVILTVLGVIVANRNINLRRGSRSVQ